MAIIVKTQLGTRGPWHQEDQALSVGPLNLLKAVRVAVKASASNAGAGYRTVIEIDGRGLSRISPGWPKTRQEARDVLEVFALKAERRADREDLTPWCAPGESVQDMLQRAAERDRD